MPLMYFSASINGILKALMSNDLLSLISDFIYLHFTQCHNILSEFVCL